MIPSSHPHYHPHPVTHLYTHTPYTITVTLTHSLTHSDPLLVVDGAAAPVSDGAPVNSPLSGDDDDQVSHSLPPHTIPTHLGYRKYI